MEGEAAQRIPLRASMAFKKTILKIVTNILFTMKRFFPNENRFTPTAGSDDASTKLTVAPEIARNLGRDGRLFKWS